MTSRERWTVYPLLFLTLGIALKDKVTRQVATDAMSCKSLVVTDRQGKPQLALAPTKSGGVVKIQGHDGLNVVLGHADTLVGLLFTDAAGNLLRPSIAIQSPRPQPPRNVPQAPAQPAEGDEPAEPEAE